MSLIDKAKTLPDPMFILFVISKVVVGMGLGVLLAGLLQGLGVWILLLGIILSAIALGQIMKK